MTIRVTGVAFILVVLLSAIKSPAEETDIDKFLDNIRQTIKKVINNQSSPRRRNNSEKVKSKIRNQIIQKLATPFVLQPQHRIIEYNKQPASTDNQTKNTMGNTQSQTTPSSGELLPAIKKIVSQNPSLASTTLPDLKHFLTKLKNQSTNDQIPQTTYTTSTIVDSAVEDFKSYIKDSLPDFHALINTTFLCSRKLQTYIEILSFCNFSVTDITLHNLPYIGCGTLKYSNSTTPTCIELLQLVNYENTLIRKFLESRKLKVYLNILDSFGKLKNRAEINQFIHLLNGVRSSLLSLFKQFETILAYDQMVQTFLKIFPHTQRRESDTNMLIVLYKILKTQLEDMDKLLTAISQSIGGGGGILSVLNPTSLNERFLCENGTEEIKKEFEGKINNISKEVDEIQNKVQKFLAHLNNEVEKYYLINISKDTLAKEIEQIAKYLKEVTDVKNNYIAVVEEIRQAGESQRNQICQNNTKCFLCLWYLRQYLGSLLNNLGFSNKKPVLPTLYQLLYIAYGTFHSVRGITNIYTEAALGSAASALELLSTPPAQWIRTNTFKFYLQTRYFLNGIYCIIGDYDKLITMLNSNLPKVKQLCEEKNFSNEFNYATLGLYLSFIRDLVLNFNKSTLEKYDNEFSKYCPSTPIPETEGEFGSFPILALVYFNTINLITLQENFLGIDKDTPFQVRFKLLQENEEELLAKFNTKYYDSQLEFHANSCPWNSYQLVSAAVCKPEIERICKTCKDKFQSRTETQEEKKKCVADAMKQSTNPFIPYLGVDFFYHICDDLLHPSTFEKIKENRQKFWKDKIQPSSETIVTGDFNSMMNELATQFSGGNLFELSQNIYPEIKKNFPEIFKEIIDDFFGQLDWDFTKKFKNLNKLCTKLW